ncbi:double zinc ribbon domain-containing protein [Methanobacterium oryzae]|uniref:double zinc ribbon domain-containing protein n=1 Tax=Methanobacterium oryzae TaxID=69540 RepID=UPI003D25E58B
MVSSDEISRKLKAKREGKEFDEKNVKIEAKGINKSDNGIICPNCSLKNPYGAVFCVGCGKKLAVEEKVEILAPKPGIPANGSEKVTTNKTNKSIASLVNKSENVQYNPAVKPSIPTKNEENLNMEHDKEICPDCGAQNRMKAEFCTECGNKLGSNPTIKPIIPANKGKGIQYNPVASSGKLFSPEKKENEKNYVMKGLGLIALSVIVFIIFAAMDRLSFWAIILFIAGIYYIIKGSSKKAVN